MIKCLKKWTTYDVSLLFISVAIMLYFGVLWNDSMLSFITAIAGVIAAILCAKGMASNYGFKLLSIIIYVLISYNHQLYGEVIFNVVYYIPMIFIGMAKWKKNKIKGNNSYVQTRIMRSRQFNMLILLSMVAVIISYLILIEMGDKLALLDSITTILSLIAMYLEVERYAESWIIWIIVDLTSIMLWYAALVSIKSNNIVILIMWCSYLVNSIYGYINWKKLARKRGLVKIR
ncbi:nicotinamide mononucleotide transporter [Clostridium collagenovorans DSM 3089]|uniref:Nicotinamide mononucleotide transporter n=1 Tax=Clostridium collagenovorans DSM 3089 TaxID=1121306 RepID=A0A1M5VH67_9CLOT|nr:nicotinamide riboside transporter PnuC [Clostridium collagenovorans]SHH74577.1 nicotinamide mononucleotide transporter [Clostridium collagenovorans DSM 3089]